LVRSNLFGSYKLKNTHAGVTLKHMNYLLVANDGIVDFVFDADAFEGVETLLSRILKNLGFLLDPSQIFGLANQRIVDQRRQVRLSLLLEVLAAVSLEVGRDRLDLLVNALLLKLKQLVDAELPLLLRDKVVVSVDAERLLDQKGRQLLHRLQLCLVKLSILQEAMPKTRSVILERPRLER